MSPPSPVSFRRRRSPSYASDSETLHSIEAELKSMQYMFGALLNLPGSAEPLLGHSCNHRFDVSVVFTALSANAQELVVCAQCLKNGDFRRQLHMLLETDSPAGFRVCVLMDGDRIAERAWATPMGGPEVSAAIFEGDVARMLVLCKKRNFRDCGAFAQARFTCLCNTCSELGRLTYEQWLELL